MAVASPFCEHKRLRTACATCRSLATPTSPPLDAKPYVPTDERGAPDTPKRRAGSSPSAPPSPSASATPPAPARPTGPGKPLMPTRAKKQRITAEDEAKAQAWWVKKD